MSQNLSSAAVVIGALRDKTYFYVDFTCLNLAIDKWDIYVERGLISMCIHGLLHNITHFGK